MRDAYFFCASENETPLMVALMVGAAKPQWSGTRQRRWGNETPPVGQQDLQGVLFLFYLHYLLDDIPIRHRHFHNNSWWIRMVGNVVR